MIIKIGANEYKHQFKIITLNAKTGIRGFVDADGVMVWKEDILAALNELAQLRQERDELKKEIMEAVGIIERLHPIVKSDSSWLRRNKKESPDEV